MNFSQAQEPEENTETSLLSNLIKFPLFSDSIAAGTSTGTHHSEPPTPPRTPIIGGSVTSAPASGAADLTGTDPTNHAAVAAIIENFQQTLSERIIRLHREGIAASADDPAEQSSCSNADNDGGISGSNGSPKISVTPASKLMDASKLRRITRPASPSDVTVATGDAGGTCDSYSEQDCDEDAASRAFDLSFRYANDSNLSPSVCSEEDLYSETGTGVDSLNDASSYDSMRASSSYKTSDGNTFAGGDKASNLVSLCLFFLDNVGFVVDCTIGKW